jgi:hypothetical protein
MTTVGLPAPPHWRDRVALYVLGVVMMGAGAAFFAACAGSAAARTHWLAGVIAACASGALLVPTCSCVVLRLGRTQVRAHYDSAGTVLRPAPTRAWFGVALVLLIAACALYLIYRGTVGADLPAVTDGRLGLLIVLLVISVVVLAAALWGIGRDIGRLTISPAGIEYVESRGVTTMRWDDLADIDDKAPTGKAFRPIVFIGKDASTTVIYNSALYGVNSAALYWMLRSYWRTPAARAELADGRALDRLHQQLFDPADGETG